MRNEKLDKVSVAFLIPLDIVLTAAELWSENEFKIWAGEVIRKMKTSKVVILACDTYH